MDKSEFDTFLFNPPFQALTYGSDNPEKGSLNSVLKKFENILADLLKSALGSDEDADEHLYGWAPRLYVHPDDLVCMGFIPFFEEKRNENKKDILVLAQLTASDGSLVNIGWAWPKTLSANYMRSAVMYVNRGERKGGEVEEGDVEEMGRRLKNIKKDDKGIGKFLKAHSLEQWFDHKLHLVPQKHVHSSAATA
ncbi:uncharacterized protein A4U43_C03F9650 [Asparagus officinalis]|uniref:Uncharacterized protein n=2 Tax=Asparagus officinalis TaxID=4686 RepID=A0A5P1F8M9_ASPOF|nr:uncharacterized protein A4U43_C03F9650 [Asparagus officinalis]